MKKTLLSTVSFLCTFSLIFTAIFTSVSVSADDTDTTTIYSSFLSETRIRDPFILTDTENSKYYLYYASNQNVYYKESIDLTHWSDPVSVFDGSDSYELFWAPEVHEYNGAYYMFVTLREINGLTKGCYILKSATPTGQFEIWSGRITDSTLDCLDGTLYVENNIPYMVFSQEYLNFADYNGTMCYVKLAEDLSGVADDAQETVMFYAKDNSYFDLGVTDAPFMYTAADGTLNILWSNYKSDKYAVVRAYSDNGSIAGTWSHDTTPLYSNDGGHPMIFEDLNGNKKITFHIESTTYDDSNVVHYNERAAIFDFNDNEGELSISGDYEKNPIQKETLTFEDSDDQVTRSFAVRSNVWQLDAKVFDKKPEDETSEKRLITIGKYSLYRHADEDWSIQLYGSDYGSDTAWHTTSIPLDISNKLATTGMYIRYLCEGTTLSVYVSADGENYTLISCNTAVTESEIITLSNWNAAQYSNLNIITECSESDYYIDNLSINADSIKAFDLPQYVKSANYSVLEFNASADCDVDHSGWKHTFGVNINGLSRSDAIGFDMLYTTSATDTRVRLSADTAFTNSYNGDSISRVQNVTSASMDNLFTDEGINFKLVRFDRMIYLLANLNGNYEIIGRRYLNNDVETQYLFTNYNTPATYINVKVSVGLEAATSAFDDSKIVFGNTDTIASVRNFPIESNTWQFDAKVFDLSEKSSEASKRLITIGKYSLYHNANSNWSIQLYSSSAYGTDGAWSNVEIPSDIEETLYTTGMYIRYINDETEISVYVSADGVNYRLIRLNKSATANSIITLFNWQAASYENIKISTDISKNSYNMDDITVTGSYATVTPPSLPSFVANGKYSVLSGNAKTTTIVSDRTKASVNFAINAAGGRSNSSDRCYGFNLCFTQENYVQIYRTETNYNGDSIKTSQVVNNSGLEDLFEENGLNFKIIRMENMVYFLAQLDGSYRIIGRLAVPDNTDTQYYFSNWSAPTKFTELNVESGIDSVSDALYGTELEFSTATTGTYVRNFVSDSNNWIIEAKVKDLDPTNSDIDKRLTTVGYISFLFETSNGKWKLQDMSPYKNVVIPDAIYSDIVEAVEGDGVYIRFVKVGEQITAYLSPDGINFTEVYRRITENTNIIYFRNWGAAYYSGIEIKNTAIPTGYADANQDGKIDVIDLIRIKKISAIGSYLKEADIDRSKGIDASDIILLRKYLIAK